MNLEQPRAFIGQVSDVQPHPKSGILDIVTIAGRTNVANRPEPTQPRYKIGDYAIVLEDNLIVPDWLLKHMDMWDQTKQKGMLAGSKGNRTKGRNIVGVRSEVALCAIEWHVDEPVANASLKGSLTLHVNGRIAIWIVQQAPDEPLSPEDFDVTDKLGITRYETLP